MPPRLKPATTLEEQVRILRSRGLIINNTEEALSYLSLVNYYYFTGYLHDYKEPDSDDYEPNIYFEDIRGLINADRFLRAILSLPLDSIERGVKTSIAYHMAHTYGPTGHLEKISFPGKEDEHATFLGYYISNLANNKYNPVVRHHQECYNGVLPIWVAVEVMMFGTIQRLYGLLNRETQSLICSDFSAHRGDFHNWLECFRLFRNHTAHNNRLHLYRVSHTPKLDKVKSDYKPTGYVYDYISLCKYLSRDKQDWNSVVGVLSTTFPQLAKTPISNYGFPSDWATRISW